MILKFSKAIDIGIVDKERLSYEVIADGDIGRYIVLKTKNLGEAVFSAKSTDTFWLPDLAVTKGDRVVIYTKEGITKSNKNPDGSESHFVYWGKSAPIFEPKETTVVLVSAQEWKSQDL